MMHRTTLVFLVLLSGILFISSCSRKKDQKSRKTLFSNDWIFVRLTDGADTSKVNQQVQTGSNWESQYNIEILDSKESHTADSTNIPEEQMLLKQKQWQQVSLPHTACIEPLVVKHPWQGICYYRKSFFIRENDSINNLFLHFKGSMQLADVWINEKKAATHSGCYTPFEVLLNPFITYGDTNEVLVRLDNRDNPLIPPGKPSNRLDFNYYSGLYRDVYLIRTGKIYIPDPVTANIPSGGGVFVSFPVANREKALIHIKTSIRNDHPENANLRLTQILYDNKDRICGKTDRNVQLSGNDISVFIQDMIVTKPQLWSIENPHLYRLETRVRDNHLILDKIETRIGIRRISFTRENGFLLNGEQVQLTGSNRHQEYPWIGNALSDHAQYRDMVKIKNGGFNIVRLGHYPQDPAVLDACDELGLLAIEPIPGWQFFYRDSIFEQRTYRDIRDMIRRDRNHPSVILWETVLNESWLPARWKQKAYAIAHEEYPGDQCYTAGDMYGSFVWDVLYNDWHEDFTRTSDSVKPGFIREYGDYEFGGDQSTTRQRRGAGEEKLLLSAWNFQWSFNRYNTHYPQTAGNAIWEMFDHNRGCCPTISASGASDIFRIPKFTWHFFRSQMDPGLKAAFEKIKPEVFIANYWTTGNPDRKIIVYGNVDEVELIVNGKTLARQKPDNGPDTPYFYENENPWDGGHPFDKGNCRHLKHPPFTFENIPWEPGEIKAIGYLNRKTIAEYTVNTPGDPAKLVMEVDFSGKKPVSGRKDVLFVYVKLTDQNGVLCLTQNNYKISLKISGAEILSPKEIDTEAGIATFLISTYNESPVILKAQSENGLKTEFRLKLLNKITSSRN